MEGQLPHDSVVPYKDSALSKKQQVAGMFDKIAFRYDFINRFLSAGVDVYWRKRAIRELKLVKPQSVLDVATGTADVAILTHRQLKCKKITGIDISAGMLELGRKKVSKLLLDDYIKLQQGDSESLDFKNDSFDAVTVAFGVRNFEHLHTGLQEMFRVLRPGGKLVVLEFSKPKMPFKAMYNLYMNVIAPSVGTLFSKNRDAYRYLNNSVKVFPEGKDFLNILKETGYTNTYYITLSLGISTIYCGHKESGEIKK